MFKGWVAFDLDGTLAEWGPPYDIWKVGTPIERMVKRAKEYMEQGAEVRIFTARVAGSNLVNADNGLTDDKEFAEKQRVLIQDWCKEVFGQALRVTATKDFQMIVLYDDRAITVETNTGRTLV